MNHTQESFQKYERKRSSKRSKQYDNNTERKDVVDSFKKFTKETQQHWKEIRSR